jgi:hypothetical protein
VLSVLALPLASCGGVALNRSFNDYSAVYADVSNRQLLLNLARMANFHPPHFLQLGLINTTFQFGANAGASFGYTDTSGRAPATGEGPFRGLSHTTNWGATAGATVNEQPSFAFTPLAGPQFAQGFLTAVSPTVFFALLDQGEPIDQLMRVLVHSVEFTDPLTGRTVTLLNTPSVENPESYVQFLRLAGIAAELQRRNVLSVGTRTVFSPSPGPLFEAPTLDQALKLAEKGLLLQEDKDQKGKYQITSVTSVTTLSVAPGSESVFRQLSEEAYYRIDIPRLPGESIPDKPESPPAKGHLVFKLRSFFLALAWVSAEQEIFDALTKTPQFSERVPPSQRRPVLRLRWDGAQEPLEPPLVALDYGGRVYAVTDPRHSVDVRERTWNRDVFTLLSYVEGQIALDPKQLPVQQLIQVQ